jgi:hypothetical protein
MIKSASAIETETLCVLYALWCKSDRTNNFDQLLSQAGCDPDAFEKITATMEHNGLIVEHGLGYQITAPGILYAEEKNLIPEELSKPNKDARQILLTALADFYDRDANESDAHYAELARQLGLDEEITGNNLDLLVELGCAENPQVGFYTISRFGLERVQDYRSRLATAKEFERLSEMSPQAKGRALQKLIAKIVERDGWPQLEGARTSHEEMDVVIFRPPDYYVIECKWVKDPVEANVIRELIGKVGNRAGVRGIVVSMSGFTKGAIEQVEDHSNTRAILLFGPENVRSLVYGQSTFDELLDGKCRELIVRKKVLVD